MDGGTAYDCYQIYSENDSEASAESGDGSTPQNPGEILINLHSGQFFPKKEWLPAIFAGTVSLNNIAELVTLSNIDKITVYVYNNKHYKDGD